MFFRFPTKPAVRFIPKPTNVTNEEGQGLVEYALILVLIAIVVIAILLQLGPAISQTFCRVSTALQPGSCGVIASYDVVVNGGSLKIQNIKVTKPASITVTVEDSSNGTKTKSESCSPPSCNITIGGVTSGTGEITSDQEDLITFSYP